VQGSSLILKRNILTCHRQVSTAKSASKQTTKQTTKQAARARPRHARNAGMRSILSFSPHSERRITTSLVRRIQLSQFACPFPFFFDDPFSLAMPLLHGLTRRTAS